MVNENATLLEFIAPLWEFWQGSVWLDGTFMSYTREESERVTAHPGEWFFFLNSVKRLSIYSSSQKIKIFKFFFRIYVYSIPPKGVMPIVVENVEIKKWNRNHE